MQDLTRIMVMVGLQAIRATLIHTQQARCGCHGFAEVFGGAIRASSDGVVADSRISGAAQAEGRIVFQAVLEIDDDFGTCLPLVDTARSSKHQEKREKSRPRQKSYRGEWNSGRVSYPGGGPEKDLTPRGMQVLEIGTSMPRQIPSSTQSRHPPGACKRMRN